jgi:hypothetical protein
LPNDNGWSSANIRDCCRSAKLRSISLLDAAKSIIPAYDQDKIGIDALRRMATGSLLSPVTAQAYKFIASSIASQGRKIQEVN